MTTDESLTTDAILDAFATAGHVLPRDALKQAADRWPEVGPTLLSIFKSVAEGGDMPDRTEAILMFGVYLMMQMREKLAFRPLCAIAANRDRIERLIGDGITEDLSIMFARTYDGDPAPLRTLIENADADEFVRDAAIGALASLTVTGQIDRDETARYLRELHATLQPQGWKYVWVGWQQAIAALALEDLTPLVEDAFSRGLIDDSMMSFKHFLEDLHAAQAASDPVDALNPNCKDDGRLDDAADHMSKWRWFQPENERPQAPMPMARPAFPEMGNRPVHNPYRNVGRNEPCPCGSGKKYKKCCLNKAA
jgi:uncharacterized protein